MWRDEAQRGRQEGAKERPCAVVVARFVDDGKVSRVLLAPITHSPPRDPKSTIEIPPKVKRHLGLDDARSWIITTELNDAAWDDPGIVPVSRSRWDYGFLPPKLAMMMKEGIVAQLDARRLGVVDRE